MAFGDELRAFNKSAEQIRNEKKEEARKIIGQLLTENFENWASYIFEAIESDIKKKAELGFFQIIGVDKKEIVGTTELRSDINGFYNSRNKIRCIVHPCFKITLDEEKRVALEEVFDKFAKGKNTDACMSCMGVGLMLVDNSLWCQRLYFTKAERLLFFIKLNGKPKTEYVESLINRVTELCEADGIKVKFQRNSGCIKVNYSIKY